MQSLSASLSTRISAAIAVVAIGLLAASPVLANTGSEMLSSTKVERAGLVSDWFTQIEIGPRSKIVNLVLQVNEDITNRIYLVEYDGRVEKISQYDLNAFGEPYGIEGAEKQANLRKEIIMKELEAQRKKPEVNIRAVTLPKSTIYAADQGGSVTAIDADTGKHHWSTKVGKRRDLTAGVGASRNHVAVVNGSTVFLINAANGKILWSKKCESSPNAAPSVSNDAVYVPLVNGRLEVFELENNGLYSRSYVSFGAAIAQPLVTESTVSWATSSGHYSVAPLEGKKIQYQLVADSSFTAGGAADSDTVYVATTNGRIYAFDEARGSIHWEYETGDRIIDKPVVSGRSLYVFAAAGRLHRIDTFTGRPPEGWEKPIPGIRRFVGISADKLYVLNEADELMAVDKNTGTVLVRVPGRLSQVLPNVHTDRLYVGSDRGLIQCIRESANNFPLFHVDKSEAMVSAESKTGEAEKAEDTFDEDDPFATEADPFATEEDDDPFATGDDASSEDPFATESGDDSTSAEDDPFATEGGSSDDSSDDPFASGGDDNSSTDDPFGGG